MNPKNSKPLLLALFISLFFIACNQGDKKEEPKTTDTTSSVKPETIQPSNDEAALDATKVAPDFYKVLADSIGIRILQAIYKPGDSSAMHFHPDYAVYAVKGSTATFYGKDGSKMTSEMKTGTTMIRPSEYHSVKNTGKSNIEVILVEVRRPMGTVSQDGSMDATKVAGNLYKATVDTMGLRVVEATYKPGQSSAMHSHPDLAMYVISGGSSEFTEKDGKKTVSSLKTGMTMIVPATTHSVKNVGKTTTKVLLVEVNRPIK